VDQATFERVGEDEELGLSRKEALSRISVRARCETNVIGDHAVPVTSFGFSA
jgi:hypothetical protein